MKIDSHRVLQLLLLGTILVLALFFVVTNLLVDILQLLVEPRLKRA